MILKTEEYSKLSKYDQLRLHVANAFCNYENLKKENEELKAELARVKEIAKKLKKQRDTFQTLLEKKGIDNHYHIYD